MEKYILYTDVDQQIQDEMRNQYPDSDQRVRAMNAELKSLKTKYNLFDTKRTAAISVKTDGTAYLVSGLLTDDDLESVDNIRYTDNDDNAYQYNFTEVDEEKMNDLIANNKAINAYSVYQEDGLEYIRVLTTNQSDTVEAMTMKYLSRAVCLDSSSDFAALLTGVSTEKILLPYKYLDLVALGTQKRLYYPSLGDSGNTQLAIVRNRYTSELKKLGLSSDASMIKRENKKIKIRGW